MIIRSQDKKGFVNLENIDTVCMNDEFDIYAFNVTSKSFIGEYSTEEKAIKVLDMIQKFYAAIELTKTGRNIANSEVREFEDMVFGCFEMPSDEEVEV